MCHGVYQSFPAAKNAQFEFFGAMTIVWVMKGLLLERRWARADV